MCGKRTRINKKKKGNSTIYLTTFDEIFIIYLTYSKLDHCFGILFTAQLKKAGQLTPAHGYTHVFDKWLDDKY